MTNTCPYCAQHMDPKTRSPREECARLLQRITGGSLPFCRKAIVAVMELGWNVAKTEEAVRQFAEPGMAPWEWSKAATHKPFRAEKVPEPLPNASWQEMADAAGMALEDWKTYHKIGEA